jgi:hypothetical protein
MKIIFVKMFLLHQLCVMFIEFKAIQSVGIGIGIILQMVIVKAGVVPGIRVETGMGTIQNLARSL